MTQNEHVIGMMRQCPDGSGVTSLHYMATDLSLGDHYRSSRILAKHDRAYLISVVYPNGFLGPGCDSRPRNLPEQKLDSTCWQLCLYESMMQLLIRDQRAEYPTTEGLAIFFPLSLSLRSGIVQVGHAKGLEKIAGTENFIGIARNGQELGT